MKRRVSRLWAGPNVRNNGSVIVKKEGRREYRPSPFRKLCCLRGGNPPLDYDFLFFLRGLSGMGLTLNPETTDTFEGLPLIPKPMAYKLGV